MKLSIISDTHEQEEKVPLPEGDILIHCGDMTYNGEIGKVAKFANWLKNQNYEYKIVIAGNHDRSFQDDRRDIVINLIREAGAIYLQDSGTEIDGIRFWGSPWTPKFGSWSFMIPRGQEIAKIWNRIPEDTQVLIAHGPPKGILDLVEEYDGMTHVGCQDLRHRVDQLKKLKLMCYGHLHLQGCLKANLDGKIFVNAAMCDEDYRITRNPITVEI